MSTQLQTQNLAYKGLSNIGATCYMNSLLQTLFMTPEFRSEIYKWKYDEKVDGKKEDSILFQLQKLFAKLEIKFPSDIDTKQLTRSFQWGGQQIIEQQDIQEFNRVLFDAIQQSLNNNKDSKNQFVRELYEGIMTNYTKCKVCSNQYPRSETFQDLVLNVKNKFQKIYNDSVELGIQRYLKPQILNGSNLYMCSNCDQKVEAQRGVKLVKIPKLFSIILQRFTFDYLTMSKVKINDLVKFPWILNMNDYMNGYDGIKHKLNEDKTQCFLEQQVAPPKRAPMVIKKNFLKDTKKQGKLPNNIKNKPTAGTRSFITQMRKKTGKNKQIAVQIALGDKIETAAQIQTQIAIEQSLISKKTHTQIQNAEIKDQNINLNNLPPLPPIQNLQLPQVSKINQVTDAPQINKVQKNQNEIIKKRKNQISPEIKAQYEANLKILQQRNQQMKVKYLQQGPLVYQLYSILIHNGGANHGHYYAYIKSFENSKWYCFNDYNVTQLNVNDIEKNAFGGAGGTNAYGLYYKQVQKHTKQINPIPPYITEILTQQKQQITRVIKQREINQLNYMKLKIYYQLFAKTLQILNTATLKQCLQKAKQLIGTEYFLNIKPENIRLRMFSPTNEAKLQTFTGRDHLTLSELKISSHKNMLIQVKKDDEQFSEYVVGNTFVRVVVWEQGIQSLDQKYLKTQKITFSKSYSMKQIQQKINEVLKIDGNICIIKRHQNDEFSYHEIINTMTDNYYLKTIDQIPVFQNQILFIERDTNNLMWPKEFESQTYRINIRYNLPTSIEQKVNFSENLIYDARSTLGSLKETLCKKHNLDPSNLILKRSNKSGIQLKNLNDSLKQYRFISGTQLYLQEGIPALPGQIRIILFLSQPTQLNALNAFNTFEQITDIPINGNLKATECKQLFLKVLKKQRNIQLDINKIRIRQKMNERMTKVYRDKPMREQQLIQKRTIAIEQLVQQQNLDIKQNLVYVRVFDPQNWELGNRMQIKINKNTTMHEMAQIIYQKNSSVLPQNMQICKIVALYKFSILDLAQFDFYQMNNIDLPVIAQPLFINTDGLFYVIKDRNKQLRELTIEEQKKFGGTIKHTIKATKGTYKPPKKQKGVTITVKKQTIQPKIEKNNQIVEQKDEKQKNEQNK